MVIRLQGFVSETRQFGLSDSRVRSELIKSVQIAIYIIISSPKGISRKETSHSESDCSPSALKCLLMSLI